MIGFEPTNTEIKILCLNQWQHPIILLNLKYKITSMFKFMSLLNHNVLNTIAENIDGQHPLYLCYILVYQRLYIRSLYQIGLCTYVCYILVYQRVKILSTYTYMIFIDSGRVQYNLILPHLSAAKSTVKLWKNI